MKILNKLSMKNLLLNKKRSVGTLIGIILSVALICAVAGIFVSFQKALVSASIAGGSNYHIALYDKGINDLEKLHQNRDIQHVDVLNDIGYSSYDNAFNDIPYLHLYSYQDKSSFTNLSKNLIKGDYPSNSNEIVISEELYYLNKDKYDVGKKLTLNVGDRTSDGSSLNNKNPYEEGETLTNTKEMTFTITGIMDRDYSLDLYGSGFSTVITTNFKDTDDTGNIFYIRINNPKDYEQTFSEILGTKFTSESPVDTDEYTLHAELLRWEAFKFDDDTVSMLYTIIAIIILIIVSTSVFCIKNSFDISVTERRKTYGMLSSVGATKKQIKRNVITEGLMLGIIGIPLGIIFGYLAVFILIGIVNMLVGDFITYNIEIDFSITLMPVLLSLILGIVTIYLSSVSSARKASIVSPMELIRSNDDIKLNSKKLKVPAFIKKIFSIGGVIAYKNLKRSKKKYRTTVISLAISVFVFISLNSFLYYTFRTTNTYYDDLDYNIIVTSSFKDTPKMEEVLKIDGTRDYTMLYQSNLTADGYLEITDFDRLTEFGNKIYSLVWNNCDKCINEDKLMMNIVPMDDDSFNKYAKSLGLNNINDEGILINNYEYIHEDGTKEDKGIYNYKVGEVIEGTYNNKPLNVKIAKVTDERPRGLENYYSDGGYLIVKKSAYEYLDITPYILTINADKPAEVVSHINEELPEINAIDLDENARSERSVSLIVSIFLYGFITVITLIGVTNIFNTITANLFMRQKEFAMLKSIGMTKKEFNKMVNLETLFYSIKSLIFGTILGIIGSYIIYEVYAKKMDFGYHLPLEAIIISFIFVFVLVFIIMRYSANKINKQNIMETIRKDNV